MNNGPEQTSAYPPVQEYLFAVTSEGDIVPPDDVPELADKPDGLIPGIPVEDPDGIPVEDPPIFESKQPAAAIEQKSNDAMSPVVQTLSAAALADRLLDTNSAENAARPAGNRAIPLAATALHLFWKREFTPEDMGKALEEIGRRAKDQGIKPNRVSHNVTKLRTSAPTKVAERKSSHGWSDGLDWRERQAGPSAQ
jgi:hypothetical protein